MDTIKAIKTRRSIRRFNEKVVSEIQIRQLLECAMSAPSAYNRQPWQFIVLADRKILDKIAETGHYYALGGASAAILVCGDFEIEDEEKFLIQGCSTAAENILIAANALGLSAVWTSIYPFDDAIDMFRDFFNLSRNILPMAVIPIGYSEEKPFEAARFDEKKVHYNKW